MDINFKEAIEYGLSKPNFNSLKEGQRNSVEGYFSGQYVFVCSLTSRDREFCVVSSRRDPDWLSLDLAKKKEPFVQFV